MFLTTKNAKAFFANSQRQSMFFSILAFCWHFGPGNQAEEARGTWGGRILGEPGPDTPRHKPPIALETSKNPL